MADARGSTVSSNIGLGRPQNLPPTLELRYLFSATIYVCEPCLSDLAAESKRALEDAGGGAFFNLSSTRYDDNFDIQYLSATGITSITELAEYDSENSQEDENIESRDEDDNESSGSRSGDTEDDGSEGTGSGSDSE